MSRCRLVVIAALLVIGAAVTLRMAEAQEKGKASAGYPDAGTPFEIVPTPQTAAPPITLVGLNDAQKIAVALSVVPEGPAVAYICDGKKIAVWFAGALGKDEDKINLKNAQGDTLSVDWSGKGAVQGNAKVDGASIQFTLELAVYTGLMREVKTVGNEREVGGWITTNTGRIIGAKKRIVDLKKQVVAGTDTGPGTATPPPPAGGNPVAQTVRCKILQVRLTKIRSDQLAGKTSLTDSALQKRLTAQFNDLGCKTPSGSSITD